MKQPTGWNWESIINWVLTIIGTILLIRLIIFVVTKVFSLNPGNILDKFTDMGLKGWIVQILIIAAVAGLFMLSRNEKQKR
jgi:hypothetical protein